LIDSHFGAYALYHVTDQLPSLISCSVNSSTQQALYNSYIRL
jgi:hypothetical protein